MYFFSATNKYGVSVNSNIPEGVTPYVVRREKGDKPVILGKYIDGFTDYTVKLNKAYEYSVRTYNVGFTDNDYTTVIVDAKGVVIRDCRDKENFVNIFMDSTYFDYKRNDSIASSLIKCLGRPYPIKEKGEWITTTRNIKGYVSNNDYNKLVDMALNSEKVYLQTDNDFMTCSIEVNYESKYFAGDGLFVSVNLTRIEDELEVEL